jgi:hypothetical protein
VSHGYHGRWIDVSDVDTFHADLDGPSHPAVDVTIDTDGQWRLLALFLARS